MSVVTILHWGQKLYGDLQALRHIKTGCRGPFSTVENTIQSVLACLYVEPSFKATI